MTKSGCHRRLSPNDPHCSATTTATPHQFESHPFLAEGAAITLVSAMLSVAVSMVVTRVLLDLAERKRVYVTLSYE